MTTWKILEGDNLPLLKQIASNSIDAGITDPPYGLSSKSPDLDSLLQSWKQDGTNPDGGKGFLDRKWDGYVPPPTVWKEVHRVLKPGAYLAVFASPRTFDLASLSVRLGGFELRDTLIAEGVLRWVQAEGFPRTTSQLRPSWEPILLFRKGQEGTLADNQAVYGCGSLNVDACRFPKSDGRWPPNMLLIHTPSCIPVREVQGKGRVGGAGRHYSHYRDGKDPTERLVVRNDADTIVEWQCAPGCPVGSLGAQRKDVLPYFPDLFWDGRDCGFFYSAKARKERQITDTLKNTHPTVKPVGLMSWLVKLLTPPGGVVLDPYCGSGTTGVAAISEGCSFVGMDNNAEGISIPIARERLQLTTKAPETDLTVLDLFCSV